MYDELIKSVIDNGQTARDLSQILFDTYPAIKPIEVHDIVKSVFPGAEYELNALLAQHEEEEPEVPLSPSEEFDVNFQLQIALSMLRGGSPLNFVEMSIRKSLPDLGEVAIDRLHLLIGKRIRVPKVGVAVDGDPWYFGPNEQDVRWLGFIERLTSIGHMSTGDLDQLNASTTRILGHLPAPGRNGFESRGLVMGYVQSGKTTSFMGLAAKAADAGYKIIIVLSGTTNSLRNQTQSRLQSVLTGSAGLWHWLTEPERDFRKGFQNADALLGGIENRSIAVIKKNASILKSLYAWLNSVDQPLRDGAPILIIDDECDQATVNTAKERTERTAINKHINEILKPGFMSRAAYVGYSATPFANILMDPVVSEGVSLYPKDFIESLTKGRGYFGTEELFGRESLEDEVEDIQETDIIRDIPNEEVDRIKPPKGYSSEWLPEVTATFEKSLKWFVIADSIRTIRNSEQSWSTMMVHTSPNIEPHNRTARVVAEQIKEWAVLTPTEIEQEFKELFEDEIEKASHLFDGNRVEWGQVAETIPSTLSKIQVLVDNSKSTQRLNYSDAEAKKPVIVVGGNTLSRGLTLEGLVSSFFLRTSSAYDSLLQMGRWFGYRPGYADLQRIWMANDEPYELKKWFRDLAFVEEEIRQQIAQYALDHTSPTEVGVRIRQLPGMAITAAAKMRDAIQAEWSFSGSTPQTILFDAHEDVIKKNLKELKNFFAKIETTPQISRLTGDQGTPIFKGVPSSQIISFLKKYLFAAGPKTLQSETLTDYINKLNEVGELKTWNVAIYNNAVSKAVKYKISDSLEVGTANRAPLANNKDPFRFDIKALTSLGDSAADAPELKVEARKIDGKLTTARILSLRKKSSNTKSVPLLGIYVINKDSEPKGVHKGTRKNLEAFDHLVGLHFVFPEAVHKGAGMFMVAPLVVADSAELEELDEETLGTIEEVKDAE
jgi:hypothetical protein